MEGGGVSSILLGDLYKTRSTIFLLGKEARRQDTVVCLPPRDERNVEEHHVILEG